MFFDENGKLIRENQIQGSIICWGASTRNEEMIKQLPQNSKVEFIIDKNVEMNGKKMKGYDIYGIEKLKGNTGYTVISVLVRFAESIIKSVHEMNSKCKVYFFVEELFDNRLLVQSNYMIIRQNRSFRYVHIFPGDSIFISLFYEMIEENFNIKEHLFILILRKAFEMPDLMNFAQKSNRKYKNIVFVDDAHGYGSFLREDSVNCNMLFENKVFFKLLEASYRIFLHSAFYSEYIISLLRRLNQNLFEKITWVCWGDDSFCFRKEDAIVSDILKHVGRTVSLKFRLPAIRNNYGIVAQPIKRGIYSYLPKSVVFKDRNKYCHDAVHILVGHGPIESDCSDYAMDILKQFSGEHIKIICPLATENISFYDVEKEKLIQKGNELFGEKFIPLTNFMNLSDYYNFLAFNVDILVNAMTVLQSVTILTFMSCLGKKIFLRKEMATALEENGIVAEDIEILREKKYTDLLSYKEHMPGNIDIHKRHNDDLIEEWKRLFD